MACELGELRAKHDQGAKADDLQIEAFAVAREAMALGPRIESLRVQRAIIKAGAVPTIVAAVARSVREDAFRGAFDDALDAMGAHCPPDATLVDFGCATGVSTRRLAERYPQARSIVGLEGFGLRLIETRPVPLENAATGE